jgi:DNA-binding HxlR family transcriptional regulator
MPAKKQAQPVVPHVCEVQSALQATLDVLSGRWKISVMGALRLGSKRFLELQREVSGIGPKMLAHTLQELENQALVRRTVHATRPVTVDYALTEYGGSLEGVIEEMVAWGRIHQARQATPSSLLRATGAADA